MPVATYYSSFSTTSAIVLSTTAPAKKSAIILDSSILVPTSDYNSYPTEEKIFRLPSSAKAGIGSGTGLVALAIIAVIAISLRQRRKRAHAFPTDGGTEPTIAQLPTRPRLVKTLPSLSSKNTSPRPKATKTLPSLSGNNSPSLMLNLLHATRGVPPPPPNLWICAHARRFC